MRPVRSINGLPNNLVQMFFSTLAYAYGGYMADHLGDAAIRTGEHDIRIDVLTGGIEPLVCANDALRSYLPKLRAHIAAELQRHQLPPDHVAGAQLAFEVHRSHPTTPLVHGNCTVTTRQGREIKSKRYVEIIYSMNLAARFAPAQQRPWWKFW